MPPPPTDEPTAVRAGEELAVDALAAFLGKNALEIRQFPSGHSNLTYLVRSGNEQWVLRRPPFGNQVKTAHDMGREFRVLSRLCDLFPPAPRPVLFCDNLEILGAPFYLMERRRGLILRKQLPAGRTLGP